MAKSSLETEEKDTTETTANDNIKDYNQLRNLIATSIEFSKISKLPVLFLSNPGYGKTSTINEYAYLNGYHVESLIGSRFSPEEILGYQVNNGGDHLQVLQPEWYSRIIEKDKEGIPSILFLDEISTAPDAVQGSLLQLVFERAIGNGKKLPESCIVLSAANYKSNLPTMFNIMAPTLNRFVLVNLDLNLIKPGNVIAEFTQTEEERKASFPTFKVKKLSKDNVEKSITLMREFYQTLIVSFYDKTTSKGFIDLNNTHYDEIYDTEGPVYNFISGRTI